MSTPQVQDEYTCLPVQNEIVFNFACAECRRVHKACSKTRPCERCKRLGIEDKCKSTIRKKRKGVFKQSPPKNERTKRTRRCNSDGFYHVRSNQSFLPNPNFSNQTFKETNFYSYGNQYQNWNRHKVYNPHINQFVPQNFYNQNNFNNNRQFHQNQMNNNMFYQKWNNQQEKKQTPTQKVISRKRSASAPLHYNFKNSYRREKSNFSQVSTTDVKLPSMADLMKNVKEYQKNNGFN